MEENLLQARRLVLIQYACRISPRSPAFQWPDAVLLLQIQPFIDGDLQPDRAQTAYEKKFLKELNSKLEDSILATGMDSDEVLSVEQRLPCLNVDSWQKTKLQCRSRIGS